MATTIKLKNGSGAPLAGDLVQGEPALDLTNKRLYTEDSGGSVIEVGTNPSTLTTGSATFSGDLAVDTDTLFVDVSAGRVGIGTATPAAPLDVFAGADERLKITTVGSNLAMVSSNAADSAYQPLEIQASSFALRQGNVGIGTDSPSELLHVSGSGGVYGRITETNTSGTVKAGLILERSAGNTDFLIENSGNLTFSTALDASTWTERMRIDASGNLLVGNTTFNHTLEGALLAQDGRVYSTADDNFCFTANRLSTDGVLMRLQKDGSDIGSIGKNGTAFYVAGSVTGIRFGSTSMSPTDADGSGADNQKDLGALTIRWDDVYATNGTIQTSDANEKQDIEALSEAETRVAVAAKALLRKFRWKSAVEEKGDDARIHFGIIAQDLQAAFEAEGLDAGDYGMFIHSTWTDEKTGEERSRMGVRYSELLAFIIAAI